MEGSRYEGVVKSVRGSLSWLICPEVAEKYNGRDVFLHKNDVNTLPVAGATVDFKLTLDHKGQPKAGEAKIIKYPTKEASKAENANPKKKVTGRAALLIFRANEVLLVREFEKSGTSGKLMWSDIGGKIEEGESVLDSALREMSEEVETFLSPESMRLLDVGFRNRYCEGGAEPEMITIGPAKAAHTQMSAVFPLDVDGVELELLKPEKPNKHGVHELCWVDAANPDLKNRLQSRWPLMRSLQTVLGKLQQPSRSLENTTRNRSRSPRRNEGRRC